jgi:hypothetical protein
VSCQTETLGVPIACRRTIYPSCLRVQVTIVFRLTFPKYSKFKCVLHTLIAKCDGISTCDRKIWRVEIVSTVIRARHR